MGAAIQIPGESLAMICKRLLHKSLVPPGNCHLFSTSYHILAFYEHKRESIFTVSDTGQQLQTGPKRLGTINSEHTPGVTCSKSLDVP